MSTHQLKGVGQGTEENQRSLKNWKSVSKDRNQQHRSKQQEDRFLFFFFFSINQYFEKNQEKENFGLACGP